MHQQSMIQHQNSRPFPIFSVLLAQFIISYASPSANIKSSFGLLPIFTYICIKKTTCVFHLLIVISHFGFVAGAVQEYSIVPPPPILFFLDICGPFSGFPLLYSQPSLSLTAYCRKGECVYCAEEKERLKRERKEESHLSLPETNEQRAKYTSADK